jgi:hypothetical protein
MLVPIIFLHSISQFMFLMESQRAVCEVPTASLKKIGFIVVFKVLIICNKFFPQVIEIEVLYVNGRH